MISENYKIITLMPPKTASNSLKSTLENQGIVFLKHNRNLPQIHLKLNEILENFEISDLSNFKIIQIVRNPYTRFVSSFFFIKKIMPPNYNPIFKKLNIGEFIDHLIVSKNTDNFINKFYGDSGYVNSRVSEGSSWGGSRMFDTQLSWGNGESNINFFKIEEISQDTKKLNDLLGTSIKTLHILNSQNIKDDYLSFLTLSDREKISELFKEDFEKFGYQV